MNYIFSPFLPSHNKLVKLQFKQNAWFLKKCRTFYDNTKRYLLSYDDLIIYTCCAFSDT